MTNFLRVGKITKPQGIKGELKVLATTDDIKRYDVMKTFYISDSDVANDKEICANVFEVESVKYVKNAPIIKVKSIDKIEDTASFIGKNIYVKRADALKLDTNEYFISDLLELDVFEKNKLLGKVKDIMQTKANDIIVVNIKNKEKLIPLVDEFIEKIDINDKKIFIKTIEGLI